MFLVLAATQGCALGYHIAAFQAFIEIYVALGRVTLRYKQSWFFSRRTLCHPALS